MNEVLKIGIIWIIISIPLIYFLESGTWRVLLVGGIGSILTIVGFIINEYQVYRFKKNITNR